MTQIPDIGSRVRYRSRATDYRAERIVTGTVVKQYPSDGIRHRDDETGETWVTSHHVAVQVDAIPEWWPYPGNDRFAPSIDELEPA